jgi:trehalose 2-sulfotransferase
MTEYSFSAVLEAFREIDGHDGTRPGIWANKFPNGRHIFMTRRNKIDSLCLGGRTIQSQEWRRLRGVCPQAIDIADHYDPDAIDHLVAERDA